MAKTFNTLKPAGLQLTDLLTFGKYKDCRVCDVVETDWEYLKWLSQNTKISIGKPVLDAITLKWTQADTERHYNEEVKPWVLDDWQDDIPF